MSSESPISRLPSPIPPPSLDWNIIDNGYLRQYSHVRAQFWIELSILKREAVTLGFLIALQLVHSATTNLVYFLEDRTLSSPQRLPLFDVAFHYLPVLEGPLWMFSDFIVYSMVAIMGLMLISNVFIKWTFAKSPSSYALLRFFKTLVVLQFFRSVSFLVTFLPGASEQCLYTVTDEMKTESVGDFLEGLADPRGNSEHWDPPTTFTSILFRSDSSKGCGDLIFSSHIMFALLSCITISKYFASKFLVILMSTMVAIMVPFTLASRKHYSIDVLTSLYVVPILYEIFWMKFPDIFTRAHMKKRYGLNFQRNVSTNSDADDSGFILIIRSRVYSISIDQLPHDFRDEVNPNKKLNNSFDSDLEMCTFRKWSGDNGDNGDSEFEHSVESQYETETNELRSRNNSFLNLSPERNFE
ncbi:hypothetical protein TrVE_jg5491 [Triparma verrucosa]|uniref:Sphingomyelin synthase-like domain-containing protein n=2 Tax=Triparma TaxID=722752 RepID=A0A9W7E310_9STRA|nr:hypothetical protein TrST_g5646 [Triparma strigata]GMI14607.1 hypothetical protein TrVE_jg5491 [Triparma verrucosa]